MRRNKYVYFQINELLKYSTLIILLYIALHKHFGGFIYVTFNIILRLWI